MSLGVHAALFVPSSWVHARKELEDLATAQDVLGGGGRGSRRFWRLLAIRHCEQIGSLIRGPWSVAYVRLCGILIANVRHTVPRGFLVASAVLYDNRRVTCTRGLPSLGDEAGIEGHFHLLLHFVEVDGGFGEVGIEPGAGGEGFG